MPETIIDLLRKNAVEKIFSVGSFSQCFPIWKTVIDRYAPDRTARQIFDLGDHLSGIFRSTSTPGRDQAQVSGGGTAWETLNCWYLNLCLAGRRTVVIRHHRDLIPTPVSKAITVNYHNFTSNTESDLIAITFPDKPEYTSDKNLLVVTDDTGVPIRNTLRSGKYNLLPIVDRLCERDFGEIEIHIIQCKTNWNDNAQIPMLWDAVYSANGFRNGVTVGIDGFSIRACSRFSYAFITVPSNTRTTFTRDSTAVQRVTNLSGGNYWGNPTANNVACSVKEIIGRNLSTGGAQGVLTTMPGELLELHGKYSYFGL